MVIISHLISQTSKAVCTQIKEGFHQRAEMRSSVAAHESVSTSKRGTAHEHTCWVSLVGACTRIIFTHRAQG